MVNGSTRGKRLAFIENVRAYFSAIALQQPRRPGAAWTVKVCAPLNLKCALKAGVEQAYALTLQKRSSGRHPRSCESVWGRPHGGRFGENNLYG